MKPTPVAIAGQFMGHIRSQLGDGQVALVVGNGVNRYRPLPNSDWNGMIAAMADRHGLACAEHIPHLSLTEVYDLIGHSSARPAYPAVLAKEFCMPMKAWVPTESHRWIAEWAVRNQAPILTTNFDDLLSRAVGARRRTLFERHSGQKGPTAFYPWEKHYAIEKIESPRDGFAVWHINGMAHYTQSVRLGLSDYMGSVRRAYDWMHSGSGRLFGDSNIERWRGRNTWLDILFHMPLVFFGMGLGRDEVFLRWLLIQRARYFAQHRDRLQQAWYVFPATEKQPQDLAKYFFLKALGVELVCVETYDDIYSMSVWDKQ